MDEFPRMSADGKSTIPEAPKAPTTAPTGFKVSDKKPKVTVWQFIFDEFAKGAKTAVCTVFIPGAMKILYDSATSMLGNMLLKGNYTHQQPNNYYGYNTMYSYNYQQPTQQPQYIPLNAPNYVIKDFSTPSYAEGQDFIRNKIGSHFAKYNRMRVADLYQLIDPEGKAIVINNSDYNYGWTQNVGFDFKQMNDGLFHFVCNPPVELR